MRSLVLTDEDIQRIHQASLRVLEESGVWFRDCPEAQALLQSHGCHVDGDRVRIPAALIEECLTLIPDRNTRKLALPAFGLSEGISLRQGDSHFALIGNAFYIYDYAAGALRDCQPKDIDEKLILLNQLDNFEFDFCDLIVQSERRGTPEVLDFDTSQDCIYFLRPFVENRAGRHLKNPFLGSFKRRVEERKLETLGMMVLERITPSDMTSLSDMRYFVWVNPISPLLYDPNETTRILRAAGENPETARIMISSAISAGATGPVTLAGTLVQQNAEILAGTVLAQLAGPGTLVIYGCVSSPMDLRSAEMSQGNIESGILNIAAVQIADHYGMPSRIAPGNPSATAPGTRAAVESMAGLLMGVSAGGNLITTGLLNSLLTISFEHLVLVDEMISQICHLAGGVQTDPESLALEVIQRAGHPSPEFLYDNHTLNNMTRDIYYSDFTGRVKKSYQDWYEKAHWRVQQMLQSKPLDEEVDKDILERLKAVEARIKEDPESWKSEQDDWWRFYTQDFG